MFSQGMKASLCALNRALCATSRCNVRLASRFGSEFPPSVGAGTGAEASCAKVKGAGRRRKRRRKEKDVSDAAEEKPRKIQPNHFLAVRISDEQVKRRAEELQQVLLKEFPSQKKNLISPSRFHLTLMVFRLDSEEELNKARTALCLFGKAISPPKEPLEITIAGVSNFSHRVLFAQVTNGLESLLGLASDVRSQFEACGVMSTDSRPLKLHLTLAKSGPGSPRLPKAGLQQLVSADTVFGSQALTRLQLCEMRADPSGDYYRVHGELNLTSGQLITCDEEQHHKDSENEESD